MVHGGYRAKVSGKATHTDSCLNALLYPYTMHYSIHIYILALILRCIKAYMCK